MTGPPPFSPLRALFALLFLLLPWVSGHPTALTPPATDDHEVPATSAGISNNSSSTNPIASGWYADPDGVRFGGTYWVYATISVAFGEQGAFDAFSNTAASPHSAEWTAHPGVFTSAPSSTSWARHSFWAPCVVERGGKYYLYYTANNPVEAAEPHSGIGVAVAEDPAGPFVDLVDGPIVGERIAGANPMDQMVFEDDDGTTYLIWGGSRALIAPLEDDMVTLGSWDDGGEQQGPRDITPNQGYGEGPYMLKHDGRYYFMWSEGGYGTPDYLVAYAVSDSVTGPFERVGVILEKDGKVADGPGHHSIVRDDEGEYWIVYHRRIIGDDVADHRVIAVDRFVFNDDGSIRPVVMT